MGDPDVLEEMDEHVKKDFERIKDEGRIIVPVILEMGSTDVIIPIPRGSQELSSNKP